MLIVIFVLRFESYLELDLEAVLVIAVSIGTDSQPDQRQWISQLFLCTNLSP